MARRVYRVCCCVGFDIATPSSTGVEQPILQQTKKFPADSRAYLFFTTPVHRSWIIEAFYYYPIFMRVNGHLGIYGLIDFEGPLKTLTLTKT